jgi:DNA repair exonuclease SbcCD nuclease subunit
MKIALITDTHFGARNDNIDFLNYFERFYNEIFFPTLISERIDTIIHLGDIVDRRKYISYITLRRMKDMFIDKCNEHGISLHVLIGNHDVPYKNTNDVNSMNELFNGSHVNYYSEPTTVDFGGQPILLMPWINAQNYDTAVSTMDDTPAQVMMSHLEVCGAFMDRGTKSEHGMDVDTFKRFETVYSGHFHHKNKIGNVQYLGAPYEMTWIDYQDTKGFHIYDTETREVEFVRNPYSIFHKIFYNDADKTVKELVDDVDVDIYANVYVKVIKINCDNPYWFDLFMDKLYKSNPVQIQVVDDNLNLNLKSEDELVDEAEDTLTIMSKYIDKMSGNIPKKKLDFLMRSLYNEAITLNL